MTKNVIIGIAVGLAVLFGGLYFLLPTAQPTPEIIPGAVPGTLHTQPEFFQAGYSGKVLATSTIGAAATMKESELSGFSAFEMTPNVASFTWTLPATSTLYTVMRNPGDTKTWTFQNATTSTGITITLAAGTGWNLSGVDANADVFPGAAYTARELVTMSCYRQVNTDVNCALEEYIAVD